MSIRGRKPILLVGEISVDVTLTPGGEENKMRLGGIVHAARGLWSLGQPFAVAAVLPSYLESSARTYLAQFGCVAFFKLGDVDGAPNVTLIRDATEVADQGYETILRVQKHVALSGELRGEDFTDVLVFPGSFNLSDACSRLPESARLHLDVAYDLEDVEALGRLPRRVQTVFISTSSQLFTRLWKGSLTDFAKPFFASGATQFVLKENRGGSRLLMRGGARSLPLPAQLGRTINSVGVGDVFAAAFVSFVEVNAEEAGWRGTYAAAAYSQTTYPERFKENVQRDLQLSVEEMEGLGGVVLPWESRSTANIYFAAPDFSYVDRSQLERVIASLTYHNFRVRRPILENGELSRGAAHSELKRTYEADYGLLLECDLVFALPLGRDPGTLVEIGIAIEAGIPVIVFDPTNENANTMVIAGANFYSGDLDLCLNKTFDLLSRKGKSNGLAA